MGTVFWDDGSGVWGTGWGREGTRVLSCPESSDRQAVLCSFWMSLHILSSHCFHICEIKSLVLLIISSYMISFHTFPERKANIFSLVGSSGQLSAFMEKEHRYNAMSLLMPKSRNLFINFMSFLVIALVYRSILTPPLDVLWW